MKINNIKISKLIENNKKIILLAILGLFLLIMTLNMLIYSSIEENNKKKVVIYEMQGPITSYYDYEVIFKDKVIEDLKWFNKSYDGIILKINSPGGDAYATKKIGETIKEIKKNIPIITCVDQIAASGAYWLAADTDYIIADEFSIVGSIGVLSSYIDFHKLMSKLGITYNRLVFGKYKDMLSPFKNLTDEERKLFLSKVKYLYDYFIKEVASGRNLSYNYTKSLATGEFFFGVEAKKKKLIDDFGDIEDCKRYVAKKLNTSERDIDFEYIKAYDEKSFSFLGFKIFYWIGYGIGNSLNHLMNKITKINNY